jgi:tRNA(fMet)-specific endonuclease VapC
VSFVLDTDICSAYLRGNRVVFSRFQQYWGGLHVSAITVAELSVWAYRRATDARVLVSLTKFLDDVSIIPVDANVATAFGMTRAQLLDRGVVVPVTDLLIAATAQVSDFTVVTHNTKHFGLVPGLRLQDWTR